MILTQDEAKQFYRLWVPLLDFVNQRKNIDKSLFGMVSPKGLPTETLLRIRNVLFDNRSLIDEYVKFNPKQLPADELEVILSWKKAIRGTFVILRHLKSGSIFIPIEKSDDNAYIVRGLYSTWEEMLHGVRPPTIIETTLLPFHGVIISDGLVLNQRIQLVGTMKKNAEQEYRIIKASGRVLKSLG